MSKARRSFTPEFKAEAARRVIDGGRPVSQVARELNLHENLLGKWVRAERIRGDASEAARRNLRDDGLDDDQRAELLRLRAEVAEKDKDIAFLKKVSAYFAAQHHR